MTHPLTTLEGQQGELITRLPNIIHQIHRLLDAVDTDELHRMVQSRLSTGINVFQHEMFTWEAGDLWSEAVEELADGVLYMLAYMVVADNGPLPPLKDPKKANSPKAETLTEWQPGVGDTVRVIKNKLSLIDNGELIGKTGTIEMLGVESDTSVLVRLDAASRIPSYLMLFWKDELEPVHTPEAVPYSTNTGIGW